MDTDEPTAWMAKTFNIEHLTPNAEGKAKG
jgi:hypothetical protein